MSSSTITEPMSDSIDPKTPPEQGHSCQGCALHGAHTRSPAIERRAFLRAGAQLLAALGLAAAGAERALAMPIRAVRPLPCAPDQAAEEKRYPLPTADSVSIDRDNSVIIARVAGKVYAFSLACPHQNTALRWEGGDHEFRCPKHKSRYRADGTFIEGRATRSMDRMPIRRDGESVLVNLDGMYQQDDNPAEWAAAFVVVQP